MFLPELCIRRPVLATVMSIILVIFGVVGYVRLPVRELPDVDFPIVTITTALPGANPEIIDQEVTDVIEEEINTIEGVKHITSVSSEGVSVITVEFQLDRNIDVAAQDVRDKVSRIRRELPSDIEEPVIEKLDLNAQAIIWIAVMGQNISPQDLTYFADKRIKERLQRVPGVGSIVFGGEQRFAVRIWLDPNKLAARELTVDDVIDALEAKNVDLPSGRIEGVDREFSVRTEGDIRTVEGFNDLIVAFSGSTPIRVRDVGYASEGVENERTLARYRGETAVGLGVLKQSEANTVAVAEGVKEMLAQIERDLPPGIELDIAYDSSEFVQQSIDEVKETLILAGVLVVLVIFLFLRNISTTLIAAIAMPISIVSTFAVMYFLGFTLNNFTLLALVLSIGVVVDDAIVMVENCFRHMEEGEKRMEASLSGSREIAFAVVASSLALIAVFLPVALIEGQVGRFFYEFGITVSVSVAVSSFVALTIVPMLCSKLLRHKERHSRFYLALDRFYAFLEERYRHGIRHALHRRLLILLLGFGTLVAALIAFAVIGKEFVPEEDRGSFLITLEAPEGATLAYTDRYLKEVEAILASYPEIHGYFSALALSGAGISDVNKGIIFVRLEPASDRRKQEEIVGELREEFGGVTGLNAFVVNVSPFATGVNERTFEYVLTHADFEVLREASETLTQRLQRTPGFIEVDSNLEISRPELTIRIDRDRAAALGVSIKDIVDNLNTLLGSNDYTKYKARGERFDVILQVPSEERLSPEAIDHIYVRAADGRLVDLGSVVTVEEGVGPSVLNRFDRGHSVTLSANLDGITLGEALATADALLEELLPEDVEVALTGQAEEMRRSFSSLLLTFVLAIAMIYLILAAQFESFIHPITVMGAVPLSMVGALGGLLLFGMTLNIYSIIGIIMLMGLVTKNSILLVDYTNRLRDRGVELMEAVAEAGKVRLRPILMTAISTIIGIVPIALALGAGAEARRPMGVTIVGGMITSTLLALFVVPVLYSLIEQLRVYRSFKK